MNGYMIVGIVVVVIIVLLLATNKKLIETLKNIYKIEELRKRILYTLGLLLVFRLGCFVVIPGINPNALGADSALADQMNSNTLLGLLDVFSGGAFANAAIFALGVMPYITASIIIQLLGIMVPAVQKLQKEGESGRRKRNVPLLRLRHRHPHRRYDVHDVARREDHRQGYRQRNLAHHHDRYRGTSASGSAGRVLGPCEHLDG